MHTARLLQYDDHEHHHHANQALKVVQPNQAAKNNWFLTRFDSFACKSNMDGYRKQCSVCLF